MHNDNCNRHVTWQSGLATLGLCFGSAFMIVNGATRQEFDFNNPTFSLGISLLAVGALSLCCHGYKLHRANIQERQHMAVPTQAVIIDPEIAQHITESMETEVTASQIARAREIPTADGFQTTTAVTFINPDRAESDPIYQQIIYDREHNQLSIEELYGAVDGTDIII